MNPRRMITLKAVIAVLFGFCFTVIPAPFAAIYGVTLDRAGIFVAQLFGASLLGFGTLNWWARRGKSKYAGLRPVALANVVADGLGFGLTLLNQIFGWSGVNAFGWFTVAVYLLLALAFASAFFLPQSRLLSHASQ